MPEITVSEETHDRLEMLRDPDQTTAEVIVELLDIYETEATGIQSPDESA